MSKDDLIPLTKRSKIRAKEIRVMGGKTKSPKRTLAANIREIRKRYVKGKVSDKDISYMEQTMIDPNFSAFDLKQRFEKLIAVIDDPVQKAQVSRSLIECHKLVHGTTVNVNQKNLNINVDIDVEKVKEHLDKLFGGQENE